MKFVRIVTVEHPSGVYGVVNGDSIEIIKGDLFEPAVKTGETLNESDIMRYLPPVDPPNIFAIGLNYADHAAEGGDALPKEPLIFMKPTTALTAHGSNVLLPKMASAKVDYEAELSIIIGKTARHVSEAQALDYVLGYTCGMDVSARDCQMGDGQWIRGKGFDSFAPLGPYVVTDIDPNNIRIRMRVNGQTMQDETTECMIFKPATLVSYLSRWATLQPGTVIMSGTPSGVGFARTPPVFLAAGDVCEVDIEGVGVLRVVMAEE